MTSVQDRFKKALAKSGWFFYPESGTWSDGTTCRFGVQDAASETAAGTRKLNTDPLEASLRSLSIHPDDPSPAMGASVNYQTGQLVLGAWSDTSSVSGTRTGLCRLVDARAYPLTAQVGNAPSFRLRVAQRDGISVAAGSGSQDVQAAANLSHQGHTPPGVHLDLGQLLTTSTGERFKVVSPIIRDVLGDTLGLSLSGQAPPEGPITPKASTPTTADPFWREIS